MLGLISACQLFSFSAFARLSALSSDFSLSACQLFSVSVNATETPKHRDYKTTDYRQLTTEPPKH
jgi:hypothetical protein